MTPPGPGRSPRLPRADGRAATVAVLALATLTLLVGFAQKVPCHDAVRRPGEAWRLACYSDVLPLYYNRGLADGLVPYLQAPLEYPVLTGVFMGVIGLAVNRMSEAGVLGAAVPEGVVAFWMTVPFLIAFALVTVWAVVRMRPGRPRDAAMLALAPGLAFAAGINWDLLSVCLSTTALLAWSRRRPWLAGVLLGLAVAAKFYPVVLLVPMVLLALRARRREALAGVARLLVGAVGAWAVVNAPVAALAPGGWARFYAFSSQRGLDWGSLWFVLRGLPLGDSGAGAGIDAFLRDVPSLNLAAQGLFAMCLLGIAALVRWAPRPPRVASLAFLVVAAFVLTNKVWSPQFVLWLLPLAVLARPRWPMLAVWQAAEVLYWATVFRSFLSEPGAQAALEAAASVRWLAVAALAGLVVAEVLSPDRDPVRASYGGEDPDAGALRPLPVPGRAEGQAKGQVVAA